MSKKAKKTKSAKKAKPAVFVSGFGVKPPAKKVWWTVSEVA